MRQLDLENPQPDRSRNGQFISFSAPALNQPDLDSDEHDSLSSTVTPAVSTLLSNLPQAPFNESERTSSSENVANDTNAFVHLTPDVSIVEIEEMARLQSNGATQATDDSQTDKQPLPKPKRHKQKDKSGKKRRIKSQNELADQLLIDEQEYTVIDAVLPGKASGEKQPGVPKRVSAASRLKVDAAPFALTWTGFFLGLVRFCYCLLDCLIGLCCFLVLIEHNCLCACNLLFTSRVDCFCLVIV